MKQIISYFFLFIFILFSCKPDFEDVVPKNTNTPNPETLKNELTGDAIDFFDYDFFINASQNIADPSSNENEIHNHSATSRDEEKRQEIIQIVYDDLLLQNSTDNFVPNVIAEIGYPIWNKAVLAETSESDFYSLLLPFAKVQDNFISSQVLVNIADDEVITYIRADKSIIDSLMVAIAPSSVPTEDIPFHLAVYLDFDENIFNTQNEEYLDWLTEYLDNHLTGQDASDRCESIVIEYCIEIDAALQEPGSASSRFLKCFHVIASSDCNDPTDVGNGTIGGAIPSGGAFPGGSTGGSSSNNNHDNTDTQAEQVLQNCNDFLNATGDEGGVPELTNSETQFCTFITSISPLITLTSEEVLWLYNDHVSNNGFFSYLTQIYGFVNNSNFDPETDVTIVNTYIDLLTEEIIDIPILHFKHVYNFKEEYGYVIPYEDLAEMIDEAECISSGSFNTCAWQNIMAHWAEDFDFSEEELDVILNTDPLELGDKVVITKKDWSTLNDTERVAHIFKSLVWIHKNHKYTFADRPGNADVTYNIATEFFDNVVGTGNAYTVTTDITFKLNGTSHTVNDVGFVWSRYWTNQNFYWHYWREYSNSGNEHFLFNRQNVPEQFGNAIVDFIVPEASAGLIESVLNQ